MRVHCSMFMPKSRIFEWFNIYVSRKAADPPKSESEQWKEYRRIRNYTQNYQINTTRACCFFCWPRNLFYSFYERRVFLWPVVTYGAQCDSAKEAKSKRNTFSMCCNFCNYYLKLAAFYSYAYGNAPQLQYVVTRSAQHMNFWWCKVAHIPCLFVVALVASAALNKY